MIEQDIDGMLEALASAPDDWIVYSILADALEDVGKSSDSNCLRWLGRNRKRPNKEGEVKFAWMWYDAHNLQVNGLDPASDIPRELYAALNGKAVANHKRYKSHREATIALMVAWMKATSGGWVPVDDPTPEVVPVQAQEGLASHL